MDDLGTLGTTGRTPSGNLPVYVEPTQKGEKFTRIRRPGFMVVVDWGDFPLKWRHLSHLPRDRTVIYPYFSGISVFFYLFGENWIIINCVGLVSLDGLGNCAVCAQLHHGGGPGDTGGTWLEFIGATWVPAFMKACENRSIIGEQPKAYVTYINIYIYMSI